jgi:hypothetical protein
MFASGQLTKDSEVVQKVFGNVSDSQFKTIVKTFEKVADVLNNAKGPAIEFSSDPKPSRKRMRDQSAKVFQCRAATSCGQVASRRRLVIDYRVGGFGRGRNRGRA